MAEVDLSRVPEFYHGYIKKAATALLSEAFREHQTQFVSFLREIPEERWDYQYAPGKWSIKELVQHVIDAERIFGYRALCFARKDKTPLPGFEENDYVAASNAGERTKEDLIQELSTVQRSTAQLFASFGPQQLEQEGVANGRAIYVKAIGYIIVGHVLHHQQILRERYLS